MERDSRLSEERANLSKETREVENKYSKTLERLKTSSKPLERD